VNNRFVVRVVEFQRLREGPIRERGRRYAYPVAGPSTRHGPGGDSATAAARVDRPKGVSAPASDSPMTSITRRFVASTTSSGKSSKPRLEAQVASSVESGKPDDHTAHDHTAGIAGDSAFRLNARLQSKRSGGIRICGPVFVDDPASAPKRFVDFARTWKHCPPHRAPAL